MSMEDFPDAPDRNLFQEAVLEASKEWNEPMCKHSTSKDVGARQSLDLGRIPELWREVGNICLTWKTIHMGWVVVSAMRSNLIQHLRYISALVLEDGIGKRNGF